MKLLYEISLTAKENENQSIAEFGLYNKSIHKTR